MKTYYIDGNNLIGKIKILWEIQQKDKQSSREKLVYILDRYFARHNNKAVLYFDGFPGTAINSSKVKIQYSEKKSADDHIRTAIDRNKNPRNLMIVTSDHALMNYASVCRCEILSSSAFASEILKSKHGDEEEEKKKSISDDDIKKLFGI